MSGQGGPHGWTADDTVTIQGNTTVAFTDRYIFVTIKPSISGKNYTAAQPEDGIAGRDAVYKFDRQTGEIVK